MVRVLLVVAIASIDTAVLVTAIRSTNPLSQIGCCAIVILLTAGLGALIAGFDG